MEHVEVDRALVVKDVGENLSKIWKDVREHNKLNESASLLTSRP